MIDFDLPEYGISDAEIDSSLGIKGKRGPTLKTHCKHGHKVVPENIYIAKGGRRNCKICRRAAQARLRQRKGFMPQNLHQEGMITTTDLCEILGIKFSVNFLRECGVNPLATTRIGSYWRASDVPLIAEAVASIIRKRGRSA
ncbi:hypothetical protein [Burkholderia cepacia]|uniref:hypothetical protein n=1 Tax=Burkholderia cepacia TaxID=292 RepID=UPI0012D9E88F|nr:hypothetical protein [Burkholderia cepacia]